jgi:hypothetical protein
MDTKFRKEELSYCAALLDGEGHIRFSVSRNKRGVETRTIRLQIRMTDMEPLKKFWEYTFCRTKIYGPYRERNWPPFYKSNYQLVAQNFEDVQFIIALLWPWLSEPKRQQAKTAIKKFIAYSAISLYN